MHVAVMGSGSAPGLEEIRVPVRFVGDCAWNLTLMQPTGPSTVRVWLCSLCALMHSGCAQKLSYVFVGWASCNYDISVSR